MAKEIREVAKKVGIIVTGGFNYPHIDWVDTCLGLGQEIKFPNMINDSTMEQFVMEPTRLVMT